MSRKFTAATLSVYCLQDSTNVLPGRAPIGCSRIGEIACCREEGSDVRRLILNKQKCLLQNASNITGDLAHGFIYWLEICKLSKQLAKNSLLTSVFSYVGRASLIVLLFQVPIQDFWGQKLLAVTGDQNISYWLSFIAGVVDPLGINSLFIRPNPIVQKWFGQDAPQQEKQADRSTISL